MLRHHLKRIKQSYFILLDTMFTKGGGSGKYKKRGGPKGPGAGRTPLGGPQGLPPRDVSGAQMPEGSSIFVEGHLPRGLKSPVSPGLLRMLSQGPSSHANPTC
ncbi:unnamed protein product [Rangifer tarandus platyrhynchus]|uniref:Uncharacterized protein n=2 Tax=Rangifer tarandus platyrhynchus TaxID=3082113 RepID=A0AC59ZFR6_RANTA|nr:unnamed protein product [Rangifer tarandus platyrhynchus]